MANDLIEAIHNALGALQAMCAECPDDDWRASLTWEAVERAHQAFSEQLFDALERPDKPEDYRHWREKYVASRRGEGGPGDFPRPFIFASKVPPLSRALFIPVWRLIRGL
jgi:hypothetical protein